MVVSDEKSLLIVTKEVQTNRFLATTLGLVKKLLSLLKSMVLWMEMLSWLMSLMLTLYLM